MKPFKIKTRNSIYELDEKGLWQNGVIYCLADEINEVYFTNDVFGCGDKIKEPTEGTMLYVLYDNAYGTRYIRTSTIKEILSA